MSVTLRLQGLSYKASSCDIQKFFVGLDISQEGITIIGGPNGEAFVDVATWDKAYQALQMSGQQIRDSIINISVISSEEKQQALENSKVKDSACGRNGTERNAGSARRTHQNKTNVYLRVEISDFEANEADIKHFFDGLDICDIAFSKSEDLPRNIVAIIKFGKNADADEGYQRYKDSKIIHVMKSNETEWIKYGGNVSHDENECLSTTSGHSTRRTDSKSPRRHSRSPRKRSRSPRKHSRSPRKRSRSPRKRSRSPRKRSRSPRKRSRSPRRRSRSPRRRSRSPRKRSRSPRKRSRSPRKRSRSPRSSTRNPVNDSKSSQSHSDGQDSKLIEGYHVHLMNLSYSAEKKDIKSLFYNLVSEDHIVLLHVERDRTKKVGFVTFTTKEDYRRALELDKVMFKGSVLYILPISKSSMSRLLSKSRCHIYLYIRNFSKDVTKNDVKKFFDSFSLDEDDIFLLFDKNNSSLGEAMVRFTSLSETVRAEKLNRRTFKDRRLTMKRVYLDRLVEYLHSHGLYMRSVDPNECVTQEDTVEDEEENDVHDEVVEEEKDLPEDDSVKQQDIAPDCVAEED